MSEATGRPDQAVTWRQLGVLVLDGSVSMTWPIEDPEMEKFGATRTKAEAVSTAVRDMFSRFKISRNRQNFSFALVKFHEEVSEEVAPQRVLEIDDLANFDPTSHGTGQSTFLGCGLECAKKICEDFFNENADDDGIPSTAVVLLLTDGECGQPDKTKAIADELKKDKRIKLAAAFFATKNQQSKGTALLKAICSPTDAKIEFYKELYDPNTLRDFWTRTITPQMARE